MLELKRWTPNNLARQLKSYMESKVHVRVHPDIQDLCPAIQDNGGNRCSHESIECLVFYNPQAGIGGQGSNECDIFKTVLSIIIIIYETGYLWMSHCQHAFFYDVYV
jgi:hypothetical protein